MKHIVKHAILVKRTAAVLVALLMLGIAAAPVFAHGVVVTRTEPEAGAALTSAPGQITAVFNEELNTHLSTIAVVRADGTQVDLKDGGVDLTDPDHASMIVHVPDNLPEAAYIVRWHVVLDDGDASDGSFSFTVGNAQPVSEQAPSLASAPAGNPLLWVEAGAALLAVVALSFLWRRRNA